MSWNFSRTLSSCGRTEIWRKSLSISFGGYTLGTGLINACLYITGYLHCTMLAHMMHVQHGASFLKNRFSSQASILSAPVSFLGLRCSRVALTCLTVCMGGGTSFNRGITVLISRTSVGAASFQGLVNTYCRRSARSAIASAGGLLIWESSAAASPYIILYYFAGLKLRRLSALVTLSNRGRNFLFPTLEVWTLCHRVAYICHCLHSCKHVAELWILS